MTIRISALALDASGGMAWVGEWGRFYVFGVDPAARVPEINIQSIADFGRIDASTEEGFALIIGNEGSACLGFGEATIEDGLPLTLLDPLPEAIAPGELAVVEIVAAPEDELPDQGDLVIETDDPDEEQAVVRVQWNQPGIGIGDPAINFTMQDEDGVIWSLTDLSGSCVLLAYFATF